MIPRRLLFTAVLLAAASLVRGENPFADFAALSAAPAVNPAPAPGPVNASALQPIFYESVPWRGRPTRVFAWYGRPANATRRVPGIVLVHGGGGTAFRYWAKLWLDRGYAVIAMDTTGGVPENGGDRSSDRSSPHLDGGPNLNRVFADASLPSTEQWPYHAVAAVIKAHSFLRAQPGVDPDRIGLTGISWGGVIGEIVLGLDHRFRFGAIIYGNGFLSESSWWKDHEMARLPETAVRRWTELWDPAGYLGRATAPILFCNGVMDKHFRPDAWTRTVQLIPPERRTLAYRPIMSHAHPPAGDPPEVRVFADALVKDGPPLPRIVRQDGGEIVYESVEPVIKAELNFTADRGDWSKRRWHSVPVGLDLVAQRVRIVVPPEAAAWFVNLYDRRNCLVSTVMTERAAP